MDRKEQLARLHRHLTQAVAFTLTAYELAEPAEDAPPDRHRIQDYNANLAAVEGHIEKASGALTDIRIYQPQ